VDHVVLDSARGRVLCGAYKPATRGPHTGRPAEQAETLEEMIGLWEIGPPSRLEPPKLGPLEQLTLLAAGEEQGRQGRRREGARTRAASAGDEVRVATRPTRRIPGV
jgi:hypothetical protein